MAGRRIVVAFLGLVFLSAHEGFAHVRRYVWTEQYNTLPQGGFELESWTTFKVPDWDKSGENLVEYQGELEYGVTDHWTVAHYERWKRENQTGVDDDGVGKKDSTFYEGFKFESKYRIGEKGKYWLDPLLYLEWSTEPRERRENKNVNAIEAKVVLSKDFGKWNVAYNQIMESGLGKRGRTEQNFSLGASYEIFSGVRVGGEFFGNYWKPASHRNELSIGPTLSYESQYFWVTAGFGFGANHAGDDTEARVIVGVPF